MNGKQDQCTILNNILKYDYFQLKKEDEATSEFDDTENYDRILLGVAVIVFLWLGLAEKSANLLYNSLKDLKHGLNLLQA